MQWTGRKPSHIALITLFGTLCVVLAVIIFRHDKQATPEALTPIEAAPTDVSIPNGARHPLIGRYADAQEQLEQRVDSSRRGSWSCRVESLPQFSVFADDGNVGRLTGYAGSLAASRNAEHVLAAAMLSSVYDKGAADELLEAALALDPTHPQVLWWAADLCTREHQPDACNDPAIRNRILSANRDNGAYWATLANQQLRNGDRRRAIESLRRASTAAVLDYNSAQQVLLLERGLSAVSDLSYGQRFTLVLAYAPLAGDHSELYTACRELIADDDAWARACLDFGRRAAADSETIIMKMIGYGVQRNVLSATGDTDRLQAINEAQDSLRRSVRDYANDWHLLILADPRFTAQYVDHFAVHGEVGAMEFAREEITRLKASPDYDPCALAEAVDLSGNVQ